MPTVSSKDGTKIAYTKIGQGPALILVGGALCYRDFGPAKGFAALLKDQFTVYIYMIVAVVVKAGIRHRTRYRRRLKILMLLRVRLLSQCTCLVSHPVVCWRL